MERLTAHFELTGQLARCSLLADRSGLFRRQGTLTATVGPLPFATDIP